MTGAAYFFGHPVTFSEQPGISMPGFFLHIMNPQTFLRIAHIFAIIALLLTSPPCNAQTVPVYKDAKAPLEARVNDLFGRMTQDEKLGFLTGTGFTTQPLPRLGVPAMGMVDAGQGVRGGADSTQGPATQFPSGVVMASSWDPMLVSRIGKAIGEEALNKGTGAQVLLGPAVNIQRSPLGGRNSEYFSEDPHLAGALAVGYIQGMQSTGCAACVKHYAANNEEVDRSSVNVNVDERTLREMYLPAFESAVKDGHVWSVMASYNRVGGYYATANKYLLTDILKNGWGWDGLVMSDWGAVHETSGIIAAGNDLEMPGGAYLTHDKVARALKSGRVTQAEIDDSVRRILRAIVRVGLLDGPRTIDHGIVNSPAHQKLAYEAACSGIVLLKNSNSILPIDAARIKSIAVIGPGAKGMQLGSQGSPSVQPFYAIQPLDGIKTRVGNDVTVNYAAGLESGSPVPASMLTPASGAGSGLRGEYYANRNLAGQPAVARVDPALQFNWRYDAPAPGVPRTEFSVRWTGTLIAPVSGRYTLALSGDDGYRLFLDGKQVIDHWFEGGISTQAVEVNFEAGSRHHLRIEYFQAAGDAVLRFNWVLPGAPSFVDAVEAAKKSDVAVVCVTTAGTEGEGEDRPSMALPGDQDALIRAVVAANPKTIVVLNNGTPVLMPWLASVPGLVEAWFPGDEGGHALASVLFGDVNPSGKLPTTLGARREDYPDFGHFPGRNGQVTYAEGIYVGYRHFDKQRLVPLFPFGYGLSYTTFKYGPLRLSHPVLPPQATVSVSVAITNIGTRAGAEVVELYVHDPAPKVDKEVQALKGFGKVDLLPGQTKNVTMTLRPRDLAYCDVPGKQWKADAGVYDIQVGASSREIRRQVSLRLGQDYTQSIVQMGAPGPPVHNKNDLAYRRPVTSSSVQEADTPAAAITDGDDSTRWSSSFADPQWVAIDLGKPVMIDHVRLLWEDAYASAYSVQVSTDSKTWTDVYHTVDGTGDLETIKFAPAAARYVRIFGTKRATEFGYSLFSVEVYAPGT